MMALLRNNSSNQRPQRRY